MHRTHLPPPRHIHRAVVSAGAMILAATISLTPFLARAQEKSAKFTIQDRNGITLYTPDAVAPALAFPYRALAAQLLDGLVDPTKDAGVPFQLTVDARVQFVTEKALRSAKRGAAVVLDAQTGDILAMASVPSFDPNTLAEERGKLMNDATQPLTNRAVRAFAPGASFLPVTGMAMARAKLEGRQYECTGLVTYGNKTFKCWIHERDGSGHGLLSVDEALKVSCGPFFYQGGNAAGIELIGMASKLLGLGAMSGLELRSEEPGLIPSPEWLSTISPGDRWSMGYTANTAIGQGFVLASPLQMARVAATIGNAKRVPGLRLRMDRAASPAMDLQENGINAESIEPIRRGMVKAVESGTGQRAQISGIAVAGKTGTAQYWRPNNEKDNHCWFIAYAPAEAPKVAVCVLVQGALTGGGVAAPIARKIMEGALSGNPPAPQALDAAIGSFEKIDSVEE